MIPPTETNPIEETQLSCVSVASMLQFHVSDKCLPDASSIGSDTLTNQTTVSAIDSTPHWTWSQHLIFANFFMFVYQTVSTVQLIVQRNPRYWPRHAFSIITDTLLGSTNVRGPLTTSFVHINYLSNREPFRFLTAGFLHGDILHLLLNLYALRQLPSWVESGLGTSLFVTTFLVAIVTGNIGHSIVMASSPARTFCLGASGGICGLYGLMYVALTKMGQSQGASRISANYQKDYQMRRKNSLQADMFPQSYRQVMGFGMAPSKSGFLPVQAIWVAVGILLLSEPRYQSMPGNIVRGLLHPGSLSRF
ncbi:Rhomboid family [Seminavis robusta]|uniref:Rhomboid family n=1 Tax=Seminavis robusta TaxID=568900 RepID=A0A9N8DZL8_9STRA|nr:Rhomboid family [Seminavis robusta]|eukprot:Sro367_g127860.1 Rhomboid family (307) ;mRNA; r:71381-72506